MFRRLIPGLVAGCMVLLADTSFTSGSTPSRTTEARTVARLVARPIPARNLYTLTNQLVLRSTQAIPRVVRYTSPNYPVGHSDRFWVLSDDTNQYFQVRATIRYETPHLYIYIQNGAKTNLGLLKKVANNFEHSIYPTDHAYFGTEWYPGVDGDPHITCLVANLKSGSTIGAYSAEDEYTRKVNPYSNQREMIYLEAGATNDAGSFEDLLSHEFQHMIHWNMHPHDNAWLNEGMSVLAEHLNHHEPQEYANGYLSQSDTDLQSWSLTDRVDAHYGGAYLFLLYVYDHFGRSFIHDMVADKNFSDFALLNDVLRKHGLHISADEVFRRWVVANALADRSLAGGEYAYTNQPGTVQVQTQKSAPFSYSAKVPPYAAQYIQIAPGSNAFQLHFSAPSVVPLISTSWTGPAWWSNRSDMSDTMLTRTVNLRKVRHAALTFNTWYDTEQDYDYGYVEASTDGGKTWQTLPGTHTTHANPNGSNYGYAYNGQSKGWQNERVDLSRFAGRDIKLRFQYITDDEYNGQGMLLRNFAIPAIGYHDDGSGWQAAGYVPIPANVLPGGWVVQVMEGTQHGNVVRRMLVQNGTGSMTIQPKRDGINKLTVAVYSTAPKTTVESAFSLSATTSH